MALSILLECKLVCKQALVDAIGGNEPIRAKPLAPSPYAMPVALSAGLGTPGPIALAAAAPIIASAHGTPARARRGDPRQARSRT